MNLLGALTCLGPALFESFRCFPSVVNAPPTAHIFCFLCSVFSSATYSSNLMIGRRSSGAAARRGVARKDIHCIGFFVTCIYITVETLIQLPSPTPLTLILILPRSRTGTVWFYTSTSNKRVARPNLYTKSLTRDLKRMYSRFTLVRISIKL